MLSRRRAESRPHSCQLALQAAACEQALHVTAQWQDFEQGHSLRSCAAHCLSTAAFCPTIFSCSCHANIPATQHCQALHGCVPCSKAMHARDSHATEPAVQRSCCWEAGPGRYLPGLCRAWISDQGKNKCKVLAWDRSDGLSRRGRTLRLQSALQLWTKAARCWQRVTMTMMMPAARPPRPALLPRSQTAQVRRFAARFRLCPMHDQQQPLCSVSIDPR